jgi:hypothetical protein
MKSGNDGPDTKGKAIADEKDRVLSEDDDALSTDTATKNHATCIKDATCQQKVESVAKTAKDSHKTQETSHEAKKVSIKDERNAESVTASCNTIGEKKMLCNGAGAARRVPHVMPRKSRLYAAPLERRYSPQWYRTRRREKVSGTARDSEERSPRKSLTTTATY